VPDDQTACVKIVFNQPAFVGDLTVGETPTGQVQQPVLWVTFPSPAAGQTAAVTVSNIHDGGADEGLLYVYPDIAKTVNVPGSAGKTTTVTLYPSKKFIRGKIEARCSPQAVTAGDDVACNVSIDDVPQAAPLAAGQKTTYIVDPGKHAVKFDLVGASAGLWAPNSLTKTVTVTAGSYPQVANATFSKANHVLASLAKAAEGWVGDFYLDGTLVAVQVGSIDQWVAANANHKVEVKNITLAGSPGIHPYYDASKSFYATAGGTSTVSVTMTKVPDSVLKGVSTPDLNSDSYIAWRPSWMAQTAELAEQTADQLTMTVILNGVNVGDVRPYRRPASLRTSPSSCVLPEWTPCYIVVWVIPFGKLPPGTHTIHGEATYGVILFNGWETFYPDWYFVWDRTFEVKPATP
jgi:hypothetical protein